MAAISQADLIAHLPALTAAGIGLRHGCTSVSCLSGFQHSTLGLSSSPSSRRAPTYRPFGGRVRSGSRPGPAIDRLLKPGAAFATVRTLARVDVAGTRGERDNPMSEDHVKYDSQLIQKFADRLYAEAERVVLQSTVVATLVGATAGYVIAALTRVQTVGFVLVCAVVAAGMGYVRGREKAFTLKWQAQQALCLMHTERSTRFVAVSVSRRSAEAVLHSDRPAEQGTTS